MGGIMPEWLVDALNAKAEAQKPKWLKDAILARLEEDERGSQPTPTKTEVETLSIDEIASAIIKREGGFVDDPDDPGGATNFGVTIGTMKSLGIDLNADGVVDKADVKLLTFDKAKEIFITEFFERPGINKLPKELQATVFDMQVNSGGNAIKILQRTLNETNDFDLAVDGILGPNTLKAATTEFRELGGELVNNYGVARRDYYYNLGDRREKSRKFARRLDGGKGGWIKRAEEFLPPELHLTEEQHRARTSVWE